MRKYDLTNALAVEPSLSSCTYAISHFWLLYFFGMLYYDPRNRLGCKESIPMLCASNTENRARARERAHPPSSPYKDSNQNSES